GFFAGLMPAETAPVRLLGLLPADAVWSHAGRLRTDLIVRAALRSIASWNLDDEQTLDAATQALRENVAEELGFELERGLGAQLAGAAAVIVLRPVAEAAGFAEPRAVLAFGVRDEQTFAAGWKKLIGWTGLSGTRYQHRGFDVE